MSALAAGIAGEVIGAVANAADELFTSDEERLKAEIESRKVGIEEMRVDNEMAREQIAVNKVEAAHGSIFVAGWRPALGWVGVGGMAYQYLAYPMLVWGWALAQAQGWVPKEASPPPILDIEALLVLLTGILGLSSTRTFEKVRGVARRITPSLRQKSISPGESE